MGSLAAVAELADAHGSGPCPLNEGGGSTPFGGTQDGKPGMQKTGDSQQGTVACRLFLRALPGPFKLATFDEELEKIRIGFQLHVLDRLDEVFQLLTPAL